ncbi:hypothetical protein LPW11_00375 [Geomonas sp. RF6]|uniref:hypothetical protein n=1 Tax=Geomonas sp. RF6 TaxID=2897342 RepID=UPI001E64AB0D|nr:hypothetical protein [Geomonas sp. RF6]UFS70662.1 hypothetical protein LPW11_00375 [Geomonas sp. RF6]
MTKLSTWLIAATVLLATAQAGGADTGWTCALTRGIQCDPDEGCVDLSPQEMNLPRFVRIDSAAKTMTSLDKQVPRKTKIASVERVSEMTVMHGTELRGWTLALAEDSGDVTLSAAGDGEGFIVFGTCIQQ